MKKFVETVAAVAITAIAITTTAEAVKVIKNDVVKPIKEWATKDKKKKGDKKTTDEKKEE